MSALVKICGLSKMADVQAVNAAQAEYAGFVFFDKSPRNICVQTAANLSAHLAEGTQSVALLVNPSDDACQALLETFQPDLIQLHGSETPQRVAAIKSLCRRPVIKALGISSADDIDAASEYETVADMLLFDAKPPADAMLPGGRGVAFDWSLLNGYKGGLPWMLSGGLTVGNVADAIAATGTSAVDVSSGVETSPGVKAAEKISDFVSAAKGKA
ncbi:MAG: phosphoribosylanthranilate isomerase [Parvibaculales bacterium]